MSNACKSCGKNGKCSSQKEGKDCGEKVPSPEDLKLADNLSRIKNKIVVMSGKGGVGKSTVAVNIALALALSGKKVGLLDVDVHGPSVPRLLSLSGQQAHIEKDYIEPIPWSKNLWVMSLGFLLPDQNEAVIWRGPVKMGLIRQFLQNVAWGELDFLVVDCPPGTGDEPLTVMQLLGKSAKSVIVTTPQMLAIDDVRRSITFCKRTGNQILGVVENMSGFVCPDCGKRHEIFKSGAGEQMAMDMGVPFLGSIPVDPELARAGDEGFAYVKVYPDSETSKIMREIVQPMLDMLPATV